MPGYKGHLFGGFVFYLLAVVLCSLTHWPASRLVQAFFFTSLGSLFPDIDTKSKGQKVFYFFCFITLVVLVMQQRYQLVACVSIFALVPLLVNHRGLFHNIWFCAALVGGTVALLTNLFPLFTTSIVYNGAFFFLGLFSHLFFDFGLKRLFKVR